MNKKILLSLFFTLLIPITAYAKVYIDISAPLTKPLPIAVQSFTSAPEISSIVKADLNYTGIVHCIDDSMQIERNEQEFNPLSWRSLAVALVIKGRQTPTGISVSVYDVFESKLILQRQYTFAKGADRQVGHLIANDIYYLLTGQKSIFTTQIAFVVRKANTREIYIMDWDGAQIRPLNVKAGIIMTPRWSADAKYLLYSAESDRKWGIFLYDLQSSRERNIVSLDGTTLAGNFLPNNSEFVFSSTKDGRSNIYIGNMRTGKGINLITSPWIDISPSVSPDGHSIAFVSNRSGSPQIYISDINGDAIRRLTFEGSYNTSPTWSAKGDKIAFVRMTSNGNQIFVMRPDGSSITQLTTIGNNEEPSFSPDGNFITFTSKRNGTKSIFIMRADGTGQIRITPTNLDALSPSWSPFK